MAAVMMVQIDIDPAHEADFNRWYDEEHLPERLAVPGVTGARRFRSSAVPGRYMALYELESPALLESAAYKKLAPTAWTERLRPFFLRVVREVYVDLEAGDGQA